MDVQELLARAWIDCDPNRETGTGDEPLDFGTMKGEPRWRWFVPRADALAQYIDRHGYKIVPKEPDSRQVMRTAA